MYHLGCELNKRVISRRVPWVEQHSNIFDKLRASFVILPTQHKDKQSDPKGKDKHDI